MHWGCCQISDFSKEALNELYERLSPSRKNRIQRLRREEDRMRSLAAEMLVYTLLQQYEDIPSATLHCHDNGQPYLSGCDLHVSISHCDQLVACAISHTPVGIDIERIRPINLNLCRHVCLPEEMEYLSQGTPISTTQICYDNHILRRFFEIWTAKEAFFKKCGTGITDLKSIDILTLQRQVYEKNDYLIQIL